MCVCYRQPGLPGAHPLQHLHRRRWCRHWKWRRLLWEGAKCDRRVQRLSEGALTHPGQSSQAQHCQGTMLTVWDGPPASRDRLWLPGVQRKWGRRRGQVCAAARCAVFRLVAQNPEVKPVRRDWSESLLVLAAHAVPWWQTLEVTVWRTNLTQISSRKCLCMIYCNAGSHASSLRVIFMI